MWGGQAGVALGGAGPAEPTHSDLQPIFVDQQTPEAVLFQQQVKRVDDQLPAAQHSPLESDPPRRAFLHADLGL